MADALFNTSYPSEAYKCRPTLPVISAFILNPDASAFLQFLLMQKSYNTCSSLVIMSLVSMIMMSGKIKIGLKVD